MAIALNTMSCHRTKPWNITMKLQKINIIGNGPLLFDAAFSWR